MLGQHDFVSGRQRGAELVHQIARARVAMRLEGDDDALRPAGARRRQHRGDLGRMVPVVVDDRDAVDDAALFEAALRAAELGERRGDLREGHIELEANGDRRQRVQHRVTPGDRQRQLTERRPIRRHHAARDVPTMQRDPYPSSVDIGRDDHGRRRSAHVVSAFRRIDPVGDHAALELRHHRAAAPHRRRTPPRRRRTAPCWRSR